jgi:sulfite oxidase
LDQVVKQGKAFGFGGSIPLDKALSEEVLLVHTMNGEALPMEHGYPLRVVVPGYIGARSIKWLSRITVQSEPSQNYYQAHAYKLFPPAVNNTNVNWSQGVMLDHLNVNAVIFSPTHDQALPAGHTHINGYALTGHGRQIEQVRVSTDGGAHWHTITLEPRPPSEVWSWVFWETTLDLPRGEHEIVAYAIDSAGEQQPSDVDAIWNFKGYMNNVWHRVPVQAT